MEDEDIQKTEQPFSAAAAKAREEK